MRKTRKDKKQCVGFCGKSFQMETKKKVALNNDQDKTDEWGVMQMRRNSQFVNERLEEGNLMYHEEERDP